MTKLYRSPEALTSLTEAGAMNIIKAPSITEKSTRLTELGQYVFYVDTSATKFEVKAAIEKLFNVKVSGVNTINMLGKTKRFKGRLAYRSDRKKAVVRLEKGQTIDLTARVS